MRLNPNSMKQGDTDPLIVILNDADGPLDLTGAAVTMRMAPAQAGIGHTPFEHACDILQTTDVSGHIHNRGKVRYPWQAGETDVPAVYHLEWVVTWSSGKTRTVPNDGYVSWEIEPKAA